MGLRASERTRGGSSTLSPRTASPAPRTAPGCPRRAPPPPRAVSPTPLTIAPSMPWSPPGPIVLASRRGRKRPGGLVRRALTYPAKRSTRRPRTHLARLQPFTQGGHDMPEEVSRRDFLNRLGVTIGAAAASAGSLVVPTPAEAQQPFQAKGKVPTTPYKTGHMTFFTGPAAVLGEPSYKGHILAAEEINAQGGLLGKR